MLNSVVLMGRLTKNPELTSTQTGVSTCAFTLAVDRNYSSQNGERQTDFINCVAWRQTAEFIAKYFTKGEMIAVEGEIQSRTWNDNEGKKHYATEVSVNRAHFTGGKSAATKDSIPPDDGLPF